MNMYLSIYITFLSILNPLSSTAFLIVFLIGLLHDTIIWGTNQNSSYNITPVCCRVPLSYSSTDWLIKCKVQPVGRWFGEKCISSPRYWYTSIRQCWTIFAFQYSKLLDNTSMLKRRYISHFQAILVHQKCSKHLKKSNAACFYTPIVLKLLIVDQMWKQHEEGN